jgi:hypothetical protein
VQPFAALRPFHSRYRFVSRVAETATVPVRVKNLTDAEALEAQLIENLQRRDVQPIRPPVGDASKIWGQLHSLWIPELAFLGPVLIIHVLKPRTLAFNFAKESDRRDLFF